MSWSIEEHIGEGRPWPEQVVVYRGETDESLTYARRSLSDVNKMVELMDTLAAENAKLREQIHWLKQGDILHVLTDQEYIDQCERERLMQVSIDALDKDNAKLREQVELLVTLLRNDCDIEASWDGLRHFWSIELTEDGCLMRDRACKAEAENAKLRELVDGLTWCSEHNCRQECPLYDVSEPDHCREASIKRELGIEVDG